MKELDKIIEWLKEIRTITKTKVSDEVIFQEAIKIMISNSIQESKEKNIQSIKARDLFPNKIREQVKNSINNKPTEKQINFLKKISYPIPKGLTKIEAKRIISEYIEGLKEGKGRW